jgi:hypothetical protein
MITKNEKPRKKRILPSYKKKVDLTDVERGTVTIIQSTEDNKIVVNFD